MIRSFWHSSVFGLSGASRWCLWLQCTAGGSSHTFAGSQGPHRSASCAAGTPCVLPAGCDGIAGHPHGIRHDAPQQQRDGGPSPPCSFACTPQMLFLPQLTASTRIRSAARHCRTTLSPGFGPGIRQLPCCPVQVLDARLGDVYTGGDGGSSPAGGAVDATVASPGAAPEAGSHGQRASFDSDAAVQVRSSICRQVGGARADAVAGFRLLDRENTCIRQRPQLQQVTLRCRFVQNLCSIRSTHYITVTWVCRVLRPDLALTALLQAVLGHEDSDDGDVVVAELTNHRASVQFLVRRASTGLARCGHHSAGEPACLPVGSLGRKQARCLGHHLQVLPLRC
jgi:hypothetical protein